MGQRVSRLEEDGRDLRGDVKILTRDIGSLRTEMAEFRADMRQDLGNLRTELQTQTARIEGRLGSIEGRLDGMDKRFNHVPTTLQLGGFVIAIFLAAGALRWIDRLPTASPNPAPVVAPAAPR